MVEIRKGHGSSVQTQYAQRSDGQWFTRLQERNAFGYAWTKWRACVAPERTYADPYAGKARLPKAA